MPENSLNHLRKPLLILEFSSLAVLLISMVWFSRHSGAGEPMNAVWLMIPAAASLGVFISFIGLMYLRWVVTASDQRSIRHKIVVILLAITLLGVWAYGITHTWLSITATS
ncbi:MAG: Acyltransferase family [Marinobacter excellens HL-55]|uniref:Acyltransferase family n=1 Tax=Marinobacter excellens HL-55 TaxID=1305731 RepID=A0A0P8BG45_9GAMM|nr:MAG: Acyltransferase family [Marinobacter excellens HL-55]